jgi:hypothetical protein
LVRATKKKLFFSSPPFPSNHNFCFLSWRDRISREKKKQQPLTINAKDCEDEIARFGALEGRDSGLDKVFKLQAAAFAPVVKCSNGPCPGPGTVNVANTGGVTDSDSGSDTDL